MNKTAFINSYLFHMFSVLFVQVKTNHNKFTVNRSLIKKSFQYLASRR